MREKAFLYSECSDVWKSVIQTMCAQVLHAALSTAIPLCSYCRVLTDTQPCSGDKSAYIHGQKFPPVNSILCLSYTCLSAARACLSY